MFTYPFFNYFCKKEIMGKYSINDYHNTPVKFKGSTNLGYRVNLGNRIVTPIFQFDNEGNQIFNGEINIENSINICPSPIDATFIAVDTEEEIGFSIKDSNNAVLYKCFQNKTTKAISTQTCDDDTIEMNKKTMLI